MISHFTVRNSLFTLAIAVASTGAAHAQPNVPVAQPNAPVAQPVAQAVIGMHNGRPMVFIDGQPNPLPAYSPISIKKREVSLPETARFFPHHMGAYFLTVPAIQFTDWDYYWDNPFWLGDSISSTPLAPASGSMDEQAAAIEKGDPDAHFIVRFGVHEPKSWRDLHEDQCFVTEDGKRLETPSMASQLYGDGAARSAAAIIGYCESRPWGNRVIGYADFERMEGTHEPLIDNWLFDHSPLMTSCWRKYLRDKYGTDDALKVAFNDPAVTLDNVEVPRDKLRGTAPEVSAMLYWQNAQDNQPLRDYLAMNSQLYRDRFKGIAAASHDALAALGRKRFLVYDTLKQTMLGWSNRGYFDAKLSWPLAYPDDRSGSGGLGISPLFDYPGFDGLITPHDYQARGLGGIYEPEGSVDSAVLRGKIFLAEMDTRTYHGTDPIFPAHNDREFAALTWRNLATGWTRGFQSYWMDVSQDWFGTPGIHKVIDRQVEVLKHSVNWKHETVPGIAMVIDDEAALETNGSGNVFNESIMWAEKMGLAHCGVPYRIYLFDDLKLANFPKHCVFYFPNLYRIDPERLKLLQDKVFRDGNVVVWGPGSGISDGTTIGPDSAAKLTGFQFDLLNANYPRRTLVSDFNHPITSGLEADTVLGGPLAFGPALYPKDGRELGYAWTKLGHTWEGLAVKSFGNGARGEWAPDSLSSGHDWASVFNTTATLPADLWRNIARFAGAHVYCQSNDVLMADKYMVALHSIQSGAKNIALPERSSVWDVVSGKLIGRHLMSISFTLTAPDTRVFRLVPDGGS